MAVHATSIVLHAQPEPSSVRALLAACDLPVADLADAHFHHFIGCEQDRAGDEGGDRALLGVIGLEPYNTVGLLRSLAVAPHARRFGCGRKLVAALERYARAQSIDTLYLLTTTASEFFTHLGYSVAPRLSAPNVIAQTAEFSCLCPDDAVFMTKDLIEQE